MGCGEGLGGSGPRDDGGERWAMKVESVGSINNISLGELLRCSYTHKEKKFLHHVHTVPRQYSS